MYFGESKVLKYFGHVKQNSTAPNTFAEILKLTNSPGTRQVLLARFVSMTWGMASESIFPYLPDPA